MALPEQVIDRLSREPIQTSGWSSQLLMFAGTIFFVSIAVYVGLAFGYKPYLESKMNQLDGQIKKFTDEIPLSDQEKLISFYSQLLNLNGILHKHVIVSPLFGWLEKKTETNVYYTRFNLNPVTGQLALTGIAKTPNDFVEQIQVFQSEPVIDRTNVNSLTSSSNGVWQFDLILFFNADFLSQLASTP